jgi:hypothetical protein
MIVEKNKHTLNLGNIRQKINTFLEQGCDVLFTAIFITGKEKSKLIDRGTVQQLNLITKNLMYDAPERVRIILHDGKESVNPLWQHDYPIAMPVPKIEKETGSMQGLGEVDISRIVDERFKERQRLEEYEQLKERVLELTGENEELKDTILELENHTNQVETELESKKQIRYYAGMLGDILEGFGIARDKVKRPLAELMGISDTGNSKATTIKRDDRSGIVDSEVSVSALSAEDQKRNEIIALVAEYLKTTSNEILGAVFTIFSEIEQDNVLAPEIVRFINQKKENQNGKV